MIKSNDFNLLTPSHKLPLYAQRILVTAPKIYAYRLSEKIIKFMKMFNSNSDYENTLIACFGPYTAANAASLGFHVSIVSQDYSSFAGFTAAMADFLSK